MPKLMKVIGRLFKQPQTHDKRQLSRFVVTGEASSSWDKTDRGRSISVVPHPMIDKATRIFAMGSCFAVEARSALRAEGYDVYPKYLSMSFDAATQMAGDLPRRDNINHYDTFVMRQEIEHALSGAARSPADFWSLRKPRKNATAHWSEVWQDPYRRNVFASSITALEDLSQRIDRCIHEGLAAADVVIISLGLIECWRNKANGLYVCMGPADPKDEIFDRVEFHQSTYDENYTNVTAMITAIRAVYPSKTIVLTVSPVALGRTWTGRDVVVENAFSKATLRAVAGRVCSEHHDIFYWPSYEFAMAEDVFAEDGRHVRREAVARIMGGFLAAFGRGD